MWIDVSTTELAERSLLEVAHELALPAQTWQQAVLGIANLKQTWLLVLDNADDLNIDYSVYIPNSAIGITLLTTRNEECQRYATLRSLRLDCLDKDEACDLLRKASGIASNECTQQQRRIEEVASLLQSHALAILQAGAYIARGHCSLSAYPEVFQRQRKRLMQHRPSQAQSRYGDVYATFEVSVDALKNLQTEAARDALELLPLLVMFGPSQLPISVFF